MHFESTLINCPFIPDMVHYTAYKFGICELCAEEKKIDEKFDNSKCIHCKKHTKIMMGSFIPKQTSAEGKIPC